MRPPLGKSRSLALALAVLAVPSAALGYGLLHSLIPAAIGARPSAAGVPVSGTTLFGMDDADLARFRGWFYARAASLPDTAVRGAFVRRYPSAEAFDAAAFKEFLMLNPGARVLGVDSFAAVYALIAPVERRLDPLPPYRSGEPILLEEVLRMGASYAALDGRNRSRLLRQRDGSPRLTAGGDTVPFDPASLIFGPLTGKGSEAQAHLGLTHLPKSSGRATLRSEPWNYLPPSADLIGVTAYVEPNAQLYTDLSLLAAFEHGPGAEMLSAILAGAALHYLADAADQVRAVPAGVAQFYTDAAIQLWIRRFITLFGLLGHVPTRASIERSILVNHRRLADRLIEVEIAEAERQERAGHADSIARPIARALDRMRYGDPAFGSALRGILATARRRDADAPFGEIVAGALIDASYREGAELYRLTRIIGVGRLRRAKDLPLDFDTIPDERVFDLVKGGRGARGRVGAALARYNELRGDGLGRMHEAFVLWWESYNAAQRQTPPSQRAARASTLLGRLVRAQLAYLADAERRREAWLAAHGG